MLHPKECPNASLCAFNHPNAPLQLALGRKRKGWYLIFARAYGMAEGREVARLDMRGVRRHSSDSNCLRFWFDPKAETGWERKGQTLLDWLLSLDPDSPILSLASSRSPIEEKNGSREVEVEVLIPERQLSRWCERCGLWEIVHGVRWEPVRQGRYPGYLCPSCHNRDWFGPRLWRRGITILWRIF